MRPRKARSDPSLFWSLIGVSRDGLSFFHLISRRGFSFITTLPSIPLPFGVYPLSAQPGLLFFDLDKCAKIFSPPPFAYATFEGQGASPTPAYSLFSHHEDVPFSDLFPIPIPSEEIAVLGTPSQQYRALVAAVNHGASPFFRRLLPSFPPLDLFPKGVSA